MYTCIKKQLLRILNVKWVVTVPVISPGESGGYSSTVKVPLCGKASQEHHYLHVYSITVLPRKQEDTLRSNLADKGFLFVTRNY